MTLMLYKQDYIRVQRYVKQFSSAILREAPRCYQIPDFRSSAFAHVLLVGKKSMNYPRRMKYGRFRNALKHALI